jgi:signal transduction histidine kinase
MASVPPPDTRSDAGYWEVAFDVIPFPIYVADCASHRLISVNHAMRQRSGAKAGETCHKAIYGLDQPCHFCRMDELAAKGGLSQSGVVFEYFDDRTDRWYQLQESLLAWTDGRTAKYSVAIDISSLKESQNALAEAHAQLSMKNRRLQETLTELHRTTRDQRDLVATVSHEFRGPVAVIDGSAQLLEHYCQGDPEAMEEVAKIRRGTAGLADVIKLCLADERLEGQAMALRPAVMEVGELAASVCASSLRHGAEQRLRLEVRQSGEVLADPGLFGLALSNVIDNGLKYAPAGSPVDVVVDLQDDLFTISVMDQGPGIAPHLRERVFERFFRIDPNGPAEGAGLGLAIVKRILDLHGHGFAIADRDGGGCVFTIYMPPAQKDS